METFFLYIIKSGVCLALFYICFKALFSNDTFFRFNRWILLTGMGICLLLPFCRIRIKEASMIQLPIRHIESVITDDPPLVPEATTIQIQDISPIQKENNIPWGKLVFLFYISGCFVCLATTIVSFRRMYQIIHSGRKIKQGAFTLVLTADPIAPFSWGNYSILSEDDFKNNPTEILAHEKMHLHHRHSLDLIYMELILLLHWYNPTVWLLKRELRDIHEYQADRGVLNQGIDATKYQLLLVKKAVGSSLYTLANSFNHSKIKKRITMMLKKKSNNWARLKLLLLVPVGLMALSVFARPEANPVPENANNGTTSLSEDKSTVIQQTVQQDYGVFLTYNDPNGKDQISMICKKLENVIHRAESGQLKDAKEVTINPAEENTPAVYLEKAKEALEKRNIKARIDPTVPGSIVAKSMLPTRKSTNFIYGIQNKKIVFAISIESLKEERLEFTRYNFSKSESITLQPESSQTSIKELERLKKSLEEKGYYTCTIDTNVFKRGDAVPLPPPPLPPMGQVVFSYKKGEPDQQFVLYERHARPGKNLDQRIDKIYNDDITNVNIIISKNAPKDLKETVVKALQQKIKYDVQYNVLQMTE